MTDSPKPPKVPREPKAPKTTPTIVVEGHKTFEHLGMTATMIDGVVHFLDRSYARNIGREENEIKRTVEENSLELQLYGTLRLVVDVFAIGGNGAQIPIKAYWLNPDQLMILTMQSRTPKGVAFRKVLIDLVKALREGRLVYADGALVTAEPKPAPQPKALKTPSPILTDPRQIVPQTPTSPQLQSIEPYDDQTLAVEINQNRRMRGRSQLPSTILEDSAGELCMRYSMLA